MKVVEYRNRYRVTTGWWIFTWWVTFDGTDVPVSFETHAEATAWIKVMERWEKKKK